MALPAALRVTLAVTLDETPVSGFPVERRLTNVSLQSAQVARASDGAVTTTFLTHPLTIVATSGLVFQTDAPLRLSLNAQDADAVGLGAGGIALLLDAQLTDITTANPGTAVADYAITLLGS